jgi:uncharacterized protein GlcG (DUF336 family)
MKAIRIITLSIFLISASSLTLCMAEDDTGQNKAFFKFPGTEPVTIYISTISFWTAAQVQMEGS